MDNGVDCRLYISTYLQGNILFVFGKEKLPDIIEGPLQFTPVHTEHPVHNMYIYTTKRGSPYIAIMISAFRYSILQNSRVEIDFKEKSGFCIGILTHNISKKT